MFILGLVITLLKIYYNFNEVTSKNNIDVKLKTPQEIIFKQ